LPICKFGKNFGRGFLRQSRPEQYATVVAWCKGKNCTQLNALGSHTHRYIGETQSESTNEAATAYVILAGLLSHPAVWQELNEGAFVPYQDTEPSDLTLAKQI
jgi:hypothetical protein